MLADPGIAERSSLGTAPGRGWLAGLELPPIPRAIIQDGCGLLDTLAIPIGRLEGEIAGLATPEPRVQALMALPGIGRLTAMTLVAEIGDISRFPTARKLCAWAGLTPRCATPTARSAMVPSPSRVRPGVRWVLGGGRPDGQEEPTVRRHRWPAGPPPGRQHRHGGGCPAAAGPLLFTSSSSWRFHLNHRAGEDRVRSCLGMSRQHGRLG